MLQYQLDVDKIKGIIEQVIEKTAVKYNMPFGYDFYTCYYEFFIENDQLLC